MKILKIVTILAVVLLSCLIVKTNKIHSNSFGVFPPNTQIKNNCNLKIENQLCEKSYINVVNDKEVIDDGLFIADNLDQFFIAKGIVDASV